MPIRVSCACGKSLNAPDHLAGKKAKCPGCGGVIAIPGPAAPAPAAKPAPKPVPAKAASGVLKTPPKPAAPKAEAEGRDLHAYASCPSCSSFVSKKDAICVQCGMNLVTGRKLSTVHTKEPDGPPRSKAILALILNVVLPGTGTLMAAKHRGPGFIQLALFIGGIVVWNPWVPNLEEILNGLGGFGIAATIGGPLLMAAGLLWSVATGVGILKSARPNPEA